MNHYTYRNILFRKKNQNYVIEGILIVLTSVILLFSVLFLVWYVDTHTSDIRHINGVITSKHVEESLGKRTYKIQIEPNGSDSQLVLVVEQETLYAQEPNFNDFLVGHTYDLGVIGKGSKPLKWYPKVVSYNKLY